MCGSSVEIKTAVSPEIIYLKNIPNIGSHLSGNQVLHQYYGSGVCDFSFSVYSGGNNVYYTVNVLVYITKVNGSVLLTLCVLLQGSKSTGSENQPALVLSNRNNQSSKCRNSIYYVIKNIIKYSQIIKIARF